MASPAQVTASRANGALSNGPSSVEGKAISSRNSLKLGITAESMIIPGEDPAHLEQLQREYQQHYTPVGPVEAELLQDVIRAQWMLRRYYRIETEVIALRVAANQDSDYTVGAAFEQDAKSGNTLQKLFRRRQAAKRDWEHALQLLEQLRSARLRDDYEQQLLARAPEPEPVRPSAAPTALPAPSRVRFDNSPQPGPRPAADPAVNLALRL